MSCSEWRTTVGVASVGGQPVAGVHHRAPTSLGHEGDMDQQDRCTSAPAFYLDGLRQHGLGLDLLQLTDSHLEIMSKEQIIINKQKGRYMIHSS